MIKMLYFFTILCIITTDRLFISLIIQYHMILECPWHSSFPLKLLSWHWETRHSHRTPMIGISFMDDLGIVQIFAAIPIYCDNQVAIHIAKNPMFHEFIEHVELDCHFIWGKNPIQIGLPLLYSILWLNCWHFYQIIG